MRSYRCAGCRNRYPLLPYGQVGLSQVCSADCRTIVQQGNTNELRSSRSSSPKKPARKDDVPAQVRAAVLLRDRGRCRYCGVQSSHLHHVAYRSEGGPHVVSNLIVLCSVCHSMVHSSKAYWKPLLLEVLRILDEGRSVTLAEVERRQARVRLGLV